MDWKIYFLGMDTTWKFRWETDDQYNGLRRIYAFW